MHECNTKCRRDGSRTCGGGWRNEVFKLIKRAPVKRVYKSIVGESYLGCYKDAGRRDLPTMLGGQMHPRDCFNKAMERGFKYASLQYYGQCFAGNSYGKYGKRPDKECNTKCRKDGSRTCGGGWRNEVFKLVKKTITVTYKPIFGESFIGCYKDTGNRDLEKHISSNMSPRECF
jgi:glucan endo-1,3-alpha-glucosidase